MFVIMVLCGPEALRTASDRRPGVYWRNDWIAFTPSALSDFLSSSVTSWMYLHLQPWIFFFQRQVDQPVHDLVAHFAALAFRPDADRDQRAERLLAGSAAALQEKVAERRAYHGQYGIVDAATERFADRLHRRHRRHHPVDRPMWPVLAVDR
jgi:hypothetical protein